MLHRISQILPSKNTLQKESPSSDLKFRSGDILKGIVIKKYPEGEILVSARGKEFRAFSGLNLMEGSTHRFQVKTAGSSIELKVLDGLIQKLGSPLQLWASNRSARNELAGILSEIIRNRNITGLSKGIVQELNCLQQLFPAIIYGRHSEDKAQWFSRFIMGNGMFWENKILNYLTGDRKNPLNKLMISDLKGILLVLRNKLIAVDVNDDQIESLSAKIQNAIHLIEQDQLLNLSSLKDGTGWFCFIPGFKEEGFNRAELFVEEKNPDNETRFSMVMDFTVLGMMEVNVCLAGSVIRVGISVDNEEKADFITENLPLLEKALKDTGMTTTNIACYVKDNNGRISSPFILGDNPSVHIVI